MPTYVYECHCGQVWNVIHSILDDPEFDCDNCQSTMYRKIQVPGAVTFKGQGFYSNDRHA